MTCTALDSGNGTRRKRRPVGRSSLMAVALLLGTASPAFAQVGSLDPSFGTGGKVTHNPGGATIPAGLAMQPDQKIVVVGRTITTASPDFLTVRYNADGSLDGSFGTNGILTTDLGDADDANAVVVQRDGKIVVGGVVGRYAITGKVGLVRYNSDGTLDSTFGNGGKVVLATNFGPGTNDKVTGLVLQPDGKIVASVGYNSANSSAGAVDFKALRLNANGSMDASFGSNGFVTVDTGSGDEARSLALQDDGKVVLYGADDSGLVAARLQSDGSVDTSFGVAGVAHVAGFFAGAAGVAIQSDGKILLEGTSFNGQFALSRLNANGTADGSFGTSGTTQSSIPGYQDAFGSALVLQPDGKPVVAGFASNGNNGSDGNAFLILRYLSNGTLDPSFNGSGWVATTFGTDNRALALGQQADGKLVAVGTTDLVGGRNFALARYLNEQADLALTKTASATTAAPGSTVTFTLTANNVGPYAATEATIVDPLPASLGFVSCTASGGGTCVNGAGTVRISYPTLPAGESRSATITAQLAASAPAGTVITNTASITSQTADPVLTNNAANASVTVASQAGHVLRFYLHGNDVPSVAGGHAMTLTPPSQPVSLAIGLLNTAQWNGDPMLNGNLAPGTVTLHFPCPLSAGVGLTFSLQRTNSDGTAPQQIGSTTQLISVCVVGQQQTINIPVNSAQAFANQRLRLSVSGVLGLSLSLNQATYLETTSFNGTP